MSVQELAFALGWAGGRLPVYANGLERASLDCSRPNYRERLALLARTLDHVESAEVAVGLPTHRSFVQRSTVLWAYVRGSDPVRRARGFRPAPSIILKLGNGSERLLLWPLRAPIAAALIEPWNAKIAYALHSPRTRCAGEKLRVPLPGTFLRIDRKRPAPILVPRMSLGEEDLTGEQVVRGLKDPPPRDAWKDRKR